MTQDTHIEGLEEIAIRALQSITFEVPKRLPPGWLKFAQSLLADPAIGPYVPAVKELQEELDASERRYLSAVKGRAAFRTSFMEARETILKLDQQLAKLDQRVVDMGVLYMVDGKEKREESNARIATLEAQLAGGEAVAEVYAAGANIGMRWLVTPTMDMLGKLYTAPAIKQQVAEEIVDCEDCNGTGSLGMTAAIGDFQPPEPNMCDSCSGSGKWKLSTPTHPVSANQPDSGKQGNNDA